MNICPLCNGLTEIKLTCPKCGCTMKDGGFMEGYFGPYSPYLDESILDQVDGVSESKCLHLFYCSSCGYDQSYAINRWDENACKKKQADSLLD